MEITKSDGVLDRVSESVSSLPAKEFVLPGVLGLAGAVAAKKAPGLVRGLGGSLEKTASSGDGDGGTKKTRRLPIQRWTDVAVPIEKAYDAWMKFDEFPSFMHRVVDVEQRGRDRIRWQEKIWFSKRQWEGRITERRKNDRIAWKTVSGMSHRGIVSFHKLDGNLTRVMVDIEFEPNGMVEKMASGLRFVKRAVQSDLARFKAFVEMEDAKGIEYRPRESARRDRAKGRQRRREQATKR
jgi:uncharacterized membrane protein